MQPTGSGGRRDEPTPQVEYVVSYPDPADPSARVQPAPGNRPPGAPGPYSPSAHSPGPYPPVAYSPGAPRRRTRTPVIVALAIAAVTVLAVTIYLVVGSGPGSIASAKPKPGQITAQFFKAVDAFDEGTMRKLTRGKATQDVDDVLDAGTLPLSFGDGEVVQSVEQADKKIQLAVVLWRVHEQEVSGSQLGATLVVRLLDDGDGYRICQIDESSDTAKPALTDFAASYREDCDY